MNTSYYLSIYADLPNSFIRTTTTSTNQARKVDQLVHDLKRTVGNIQKSAFYGISISEIRALAIDIYTLLEQIEEERQGMQMPEKRNFSMSYIDTFIHVLRIFQNLSFEYEEFPKDLVLDAKKFAIDSLIKMFGGMTYERLTRQIMDYEWLWKEGKLPRQIVNKYDQQRVFSDADLEIYEKNNIRSIMALEKELNQSQRAYERHRHPLCLDDNDFFYERYPKLECITVGEKVSAPLLL